MQVTKPAHGPEAYKFIGFRWALTSLTPVMLPPPGPDRNRPKTIPTGKSPGSSGGRGEGPDQKVFRNHDETMLSTWSGKIRTLGFPWSAVG